MKLLVSVIPLSIYNVCSTWKTFWEEIFTLGKFAPVNMNYIDQLYHFMKTLNLSRVGILPPRKEKY